MYEKKPPVTAWVATRLIPNHEDPRTPLRRHLVKKVQNSTTPAVGELLEAIDRAAAESGR